MLQITPHMKIRVAVEPADFRRGIDSLARLCRESLGQDPFAGAVFVFRNRRAPALKLLVYDGQGFWLCHKRQTSDYPHPSCFTGSLGHAHNRAR
jgi:transposase